MSVKNKTLIFITIVLTIFSVVILAFINMQQKEEMKAFQNKHFNDTKFIYDQINKKYENFYTNSVIFDSDFIDIQKAIKSRDKELLYKHTVIKYKTLQIENSDLLLMNFYLPDNTVLLKMNNPKEIYKNESKSLVGRVHQDKKVVFGFSKIKEHAVYKIVQPIFYEKEYIGALELGVNIDYILKEMEHYTNIEGAIFLKQEDNLFNLGYKTIKDLQVVKELRQVDFEKVNETIQTSKDDVYSIYSFDIKDYKNIIIAKIYFFNNITEEVAKLKDDKLNIALFLLGAIFITLLVINFVISYSVKDLQKGYDSLREYSNMVNDNIVDEKEIYKLAYEHLSRAKKDGRNKIVSKLL